MRAWVLQNYNMTSAELATIRRGEQLAAAGVLGVENVTFLGFEDGTLEAVDPLQVKHGLVAAIRDFQPDLVVSFSPETDYAMYSLGLMHRDHQTTGMRTIDSVYPCARDYLCFPDLFQAGLMPWRVPVVWQFAFEQVSGSDILFNITGTPMQRKYAALLEHKSQYSNATAVGEELVTIASGIAIRNGLSVDALVEAYAVVPML